LKARENDAEDSFFKPCEWTFGIFQKTRTETLQKTGIKGKSIKVTVNLGDPKYFNADIIITRFNTIPGALMVINTNFKAILAEKPLI